MNVNDIVAIALLFVAVSDTVLAQTILPKVLSKDPAIADDKRRLIIRLVNACTFVFVGLAMVFYFVRPL